MASRRSEGSESKPPRRRPASTPDQQENQLISLAMDAAEEQFRNGTASAQVIVHFLKLGSTRERLEQLRLEKEVALLQVKSEAAESASRMETLYTRALNAMKGYQGQPVESEQYPGLSEDDYDY